MADAGLDLKNPGGKEYVVFGGAALGLALLYFALHKKTATPAAASGPAAPRAVPGSGGGLGNPFTLPGGQSPTGNAFTDSLVQSPVALATTTAPMVVTPVRHAAQGAHSVLVSAGGGGGGGPISSGAPSGGSITNLSGTSPLQWASAVLTAGGFPKTAANLQSLVAWALNEGGGGANNPLNTTQGGPGATDFNSVGVKNFPSVAEGVQATVATIRNGYYPNILSDLASGKGISSNASADLLKWSGSGYSSLSRNWARAGQLIQPPKVTTAAGVKPASASQIAGLFPVVKLRAARPQLITATPRGRGFLPGLSNLVSAIRYTSQRRRPLRALPGKQGMRRVGAY